MKKKMLAFLSCLVILAGCSSGQSIFYWEKANTGAAWFAKEHNECLDEADWWPWTFPAWPPGTQEVPELRFDNESDNGIWANFVPYEGAQPVFVNSFYNDSTMSPSSYRRCMEKKGYIQRHPMVQRRQVHPQ